MKKDVNELKKILFDILQNPSMAQHIPVYNNGGEAMMQNEYTPAIQQPQAYNQNNNQPVLINQNGDDIQHLDAVEESLSIMDKEKELIIKALKKHRGKRKDASADLGISERTLYRKLKEYDIEE